MIARVLIRRSTLALLLLLASCATRDAYTALQRLNRELLASSSATQTLERWCADRRMAEDPKIVAVRITGVAKTPSPEQLRRLGVASAEEVRYRHVELRCGTHVLSEADNWYVPRPADAGDEPAPRDDGHSVRQGGAAAAAVPANA